MIDAESELKRILDYDRLVRDLIQALVDVGTPLKEAVRLVINPYGQCH